MKRLHIILKRKEKKITQTTVVVASSSYCIPKVVYRTEEAVGWFLLQVPSIITIIIGAHFTRPIKCPEERPVFSVL